MERRNVLFVVVLSLCTFGVYGLYWLWKTTDELKTVSARDELRPALDLLLSILTLGVWAIWVGHRNAQIVHEEMERRGEGHSDRSLPILGFGLLTWMSGLSWLVVAALLQQDYNRLSEATLSDGHGGSDPIDPVGPVSPMPDEPVGAGLHSPVGLPTPSAY